MNAQRVGVAALLDALLAAGVRRAVCSPGHRNAPLLGGFAERFEVQSVIDERTGGFVALGAARASGAPVALCCTSGSAPAHYLPAVMEAAASGIPLVIITADRPPEMHSVGANQTVDQREVFAPYADALDLDFVALDPEAGALERVVARRVGHAIGEAVERGRPLHLNVRLRKPLDAAVGVSAARVASRPRRVDPAAREALLAFCRDERPAIIVDGPPFGFVDPRHRERLAALSRRTGWPILADVLGPSFGAPESLELHPLWLERARPPARALWFGRQPTSSSLQRVLGGMQDVLHLHRAGEGLDPSGRAEPAFGDASLVDAALIDALPHRAPEPWWGAALESARAWHRRQTALPAWEAPMLQQVLDRWPYRHVHLSNSRVVRDVEAFVRPSHRLRFFGNRGLSGIDGTFATAWGEAWALGQPVLAIVGDVAAAHDVGSLLSLSREVPLHVVIVDNGGGQIFSTLPVASWPSYEAQFLTAPRFDLEAVAKAAGFTAIDTLRVDPARSQAERAAVSLGAEELSWAS